MITVSDLKIALRVRNDAEDGYIKSLRDAALAAIETATGHYYGHPKTITETSYGASGDALWLSSQPRSVTTVSIYEAGEWNAVDTYQTDGRRIQLTDDHLFPIDVRVEYEAGYNDDEFPADVQQKLVRYVTYCFENRLPAVADDAVLNAVIGFVPTI
jgi:hypothetical protein